MIEPLMKQQQQQKLKTANRVDSPNSPHGGFESAYSAEGSGYSDAAPYVGSQPDYGRSCPQERSLPARRPPWTVLTVEGIDRGAKDWVGAPIAEKQNV